MGHNRRYKGHWNPSIKLMFQELIIDYGNDGEEEPGMCHTYTFQHHNWRKHE